MKKKIILVVAIVLVVAISAVALVSCASSPSKFYENFKKANSFTLESTVTGIGSIETTYDNGNASIITKNNDGKIATGTVVIVKDKKVTKYTYNALTSKWNKSATELNVDSSEYKNFIDEIISSNSFTDIKDDSMIKEGSYWYLKGTDGSAIKTTAMKITSNKMESYIVTEKDGKTEYTLVGTLKLSGTVTAPKI